MNEPDHIKTDNSAVIAELEAQLQALREAAQVYYDSVGEDEDLQCAAYDNLGIALEQSK